MDFYEKLIGTLSFDYINWKGEESYRTVLVNYVYYGSTPQHEVEQWLVYCFDLNKKEWRTFALEHITNLVSML